MTRNFARKALVVYIFYILTTLFWGIPVTWLFLASIDPEASAYIRIPQNLAYRTISMFSQTTTLLGTS